MSTPKFFHENVSQKGFLSEVLKEMDYQPTLDYSTEIPSVPSTNAKESSPSKTVPFPQLKLQHNGLQGKLSQLKKKVRNLTLLKNEIEQQTSDSFVNFIRLNQMNESKILEKLSYDSEQSRYINSIIFDRDEMNSTLSDNSRISTRISSHEILDSNSALDANEEEEENGMANMQDLQGEAVTNTTDNEQSEIDYHKFQSQEFNHKKKNSETLDNHVLKKEEGGTINFESSRDEWNKLQMIERRMNLVSKWILQQMEEVSALHMSEKQKNANLRVKYQSEIKRVEEERQISMQNISTFQKEIFRLSTVVEPRLKEECEELRKRIDQEREKGNLQIISQAKQLLK